jgi:hypothetical protein
MHIEMIQISRMSFFKKKSIIRVVSYAQHSHDICQKTSFYEIFNSALFAGVYNFQLAVSSFKHLRVAVIAFHFYYNCFHHLSFASARRRLTFCKLTFKQFERYNPAIHMHNIIKMAINYFFN